MVAHLSAVRVVMAEEIGLDGFECTADCQMVNGEVGSARDGACGGDPEIWIHRGGECRKNVLWLPCARDALVEVAEEHGRHRAVGLKQWLEMLQVGQMVVPRLAVALAAADMSIAPRDANANETNRTARRVGTASHESAWRQKRRAECVHLSPRIAAPQQNLPASGLDWVAIVCGRGDDMSAVGENVPVTLSDADNMAR